MVDRLRKPLLALVALAGFLGSITSEARGSEPCPYHDGMPVATQADSAPSSGHAGHTAGAPSADEGAGVHGASHASEDGAHFCSCLGHCNAGTSPPLPKASELGLGFALAEPVVVAPSAEVFFSHKTGGLHLLHLATAPPTSL